MRFGAAGAGAALVLCMGGVGMGGVASAQEEPPESPPATEPSGEPSAEPSAEPEATPVELEADAGVELPAAPPEPLWSSPVNATEAAGSSAGPSGATASSTSARPRSQQDPPRQGDGAGEPQGLARRVFGWTAVGVGSGTSVAGIVVDGVAAFRYADLDCPDDRCAPDLRDDAAAYNDLRVPAGLTMLAGAALVGLGLPFLLVGEAAAAEASHSPIVGPGYVGLRGRF